MDAMRLFARHIKSSVFLVIYALFWAYLYYWFSTPTSIYPNSCGAANGGLIILVLLLSTIGSLVMIVLAIMEKGQNRIDYSVFLGLILSPVLLTMAAFYLGL